MGKFFSKKQKRENMFKKFFSKFSLSSEKNAKIVKFFNKTSLIWHMVLAMVLCFFIEACSRHSVKASFSFLVETPWIFMYNSLNIAKGTIIIIQINAINNNIFNVAF